MASRDWRESFDTIDDETELTAVSYGAAADAIRASYDLIAERYNELADDMVKRPLERGILLSFSELIEPLKPGVIGDVGCGPGHIARHLAGRGLRTLGIDVSAGMIEQARARFPDGEFQLGSMLELPVATGSWIGAVCLYVTLHCNAEERGRAFRELSRVIRPGGVLLHSFYVSAPDQPAGSVYHLERWFGVKVDLHTYFVSIDDGADELEAADFEVIAALVREPLSTNELPARRCYLLARRR